LNEPLGIGSKIHGIHHPNFIIYSTIKPDKIFQDDSGSKNLERRENMDCPNREKNLANCNCSYPGCPKKGICCECIAYHRSRGELPACFFTDEEEKTWDRSIEFFKSRR